MSSYSEYDRGERSAYDDRRADVYAYKRARSPGGVEQQFDKRMRPYDDYGRDWNGNGSGGSARSPDRSRRAWDELDAEEKEREWQRYEREREWDHYYATRGDVQEESSRFRRQTYDEAARVQAVRTIDPLDSPSILPFKRYTQILRESGKEPAALATGPEATQTLFDMYQEYRKAFQRRSMEQFWQAHRNEKWFKEKYSLDEEEVRSRNQRKKQGRKGKKHVWLEELRSGVLDDVCWEVDVDKESSDAATLVARTRLGERDVIEDTDSMTLPADIHQLLIRQVPVEIGRTDVEAILIDQPGFKHLAFGEPHSMKRYSRIGVAVFGDEQSLEEREQTAAKLSQMPVAGQKLAFEVATRPAQAKVRIAPAFASTTARMEHDLEQARALVAIFEEEDRTVLFHDDPDEAEIQVNASDEIDRRAEDSTRKRLDLHIDLLRQVYNCDYYSSTQSDFSEELVRRAPKSLRRKTGTEADSAQDKAKLWASNVDSKHQLLMRPNDDDIGEFGGRNVQQMLLDLAAPYSRQEKDETEKHRCIVMLDGNIECGKPFKAQIFVQKHVLNKHRAWFNDLMAEKIADARSFNAYVRDPQRPMPPLQASSSTTNERKEPNAHNGVVGQSGYYGAGSTLRMGSNAQPSSAYRPSGGGRERASDELMRIGTTTNVVPPSRMAPLPFAAKSLDPRAAMAPRSYQDLDAGGPAETAEIELEY